MAITAVTNGSGKDLGDEGASGHVDAPELRYFVMSLFFIFGGITSLNDVIIPKLKELFTLSYTQAMLVQFCFFTAYAVIGVPAAMLVRKVGYMRGAAAGLVIMIGGCLAFIPASQTATYWLFLAAYFVLATGVVVVQVVANPLISLLGKPETASSRLTFAQGFNSLGTTIFPIVGSVLILGSLAKVSAKDLSGPALDAYRRAESAAIVHGYLGIAVALALVAVAVWLFRNRLPAERHPDSKGFAGFDLLRRPRFSYGALSIFLYVGAEVSIGSLIVSYLMQPHVLALPEQSAGKLIGLYWGGAMVGRFIGSAVLRVLNPGVVLTFNACLAIALIALSINTTGYVAGYALLAVGLMNSIMFPTIFTLACEKLGTRAADGSGIINVAICGGAIIPLATGGLADLAGGNLGMALLLPVACYAVIAGFGLFARRPAAG
ncbi:glucose/galactose transporter [Novosphingobium sp. Rr 2-17]|uniref:sugar MFS transporter n=1 Tax=Novosphingobium sp. Rr 2-17 TaxID=555793 RepID=UPI000269A20D|nr:sugar MFS transporter [Novosphingobium sp. Rr 2-17]EIZ78485.1 glucose/galactose transporter [Novosphingobium sp. Rr 2-17]